LTPGASNENPIPVRGLSFLGLKLGLGVMLLRRFIPSMVAFIFSNNDRVSIPSSSSRVSFTLMLNFVSSSSLFTKLGSGSMAEVLTGDGKIEGLAVRAGLVETADILRIPGACPPKKSSGAVNADFLRSLIAWDKHDV
jgi:hypothetical protein